MEDVIGGTPLVRLQRLPGPENDRRGNVTKKTQVTSGATLVTQYTYTVADRLSLMTYPSGGWADYARDALGRVTGITWGASAGVKAPPSSRA